MAQVTKITFSKLEFEALNNSDFFLQKHSATKKVTELFGELERQLRKNILTFPSLSDHTNTSMGKIFKGESYRQLPYVVLDYPKRFSADSFFTFRTMLWWGHEFSFTLHLHGHALDHYRKSILTNIHALYKNDVFFCINSKQWEYHFEQDNYISLNEWKKENLLEAVEKKEFIKLSRKLPLDQYNNLIEYAVETFEMFMGMLAH